MEINLDTFKELENNDMSQINGGGPVAAVYALGFVMGMSPLGALCVCGGCVAAGVAAGYLSSR